ncbi:GntR family transcriptional regulator [Sphingomonas sp. SUN039]|uniref:GntR family transcriptional regulator n=1 Tax=Sphingomonas sp. SUN039 TaxID=2937787 RepID=UPI0021647E2A|nr:GntR family transcriptional regulator [Sphingomonas sp. SUN039]UVO54382.1 GntR family transcriptional regulator [Sphingomonas sp. SUN039]
MKTAEARTTTEVADWLREGIRRGRYAPGQRLIESDISKGTGAPRSKVREALQRLANEGLVILEEFRGASVRAMSIDEARQIYGARIALESYAAGECARLASDEQLLELARLQDAMNALETTGDHDKFAALNRDWHAQIITGANNARIATLLGTLNIQIYRLLFSTFYSAKRIDAANADHRVITTAIVERRAGDAERGMRAHIEQGFLALREIDAIYPA